MGGGRFKGVSQKPTFWDDPEFDDGQDPVRNREEGIPLRRLVSSVKTWDIQMLLLPTETSQENMLDYLVREC